MLSNVLDCKWDPQGIKSSSLDIIAHIWKNGSFEILLLFLHSKTCLSQILEVAPYLLSDIWLFIRALKYFCFSYVYCFIVATDAFQVIDNQFTLAINVAFDSPDYVVRCWKRAALRAVVAVWSGASKKSRRLDRHSILLWLNIWVNCLAV